MLTKNELAKYLKFGFVCDYNYPEPKEKTMTEYDELVDTLEEMTQDSIKQSIESAKNPVYLLSGGIDSTLVASRSIAPQTIALTNWNTGDTPWAEKAAKQLGAKHIAIATQSEFFEEDLCKIQSWYDKPHSLLLAFFWFLTAKALVSRGYHEFIDGSGPDDLMMEDNQNAIITRASFLDQYEFSRAQLYLVNSFIRDMTPNNRVLLKILKREHNIDSYIDALPMNQFRIIFDDNEVKKFGIEPFQLELREEKIDHIDQLLAHLKKQSIDLFYQMIKETLGCESYHPLRRGDIIDICMRTPYELKNSLGIQKLPFREICNKWVGYEIASRPKEEWTPVVPSRGSWSIGDYDFNYPISLEPFRKMLEKYITPKDRVIYDYLDYEIVKSYCENQPPGITKFSRQIWNLLNLSIWLECHDG